MVSVLDDRLDVQMDLIFLADGVLGGLVQYVARRYALGHNKVSGLGKVE